MNSTLEAKAHGMLETYPRREVIFYRALRGAGGAYGRCLEGVFGATCARAFEGERRVVGW